MKAKELYDILNHFSDKERSIMDVYMHIGENKEQQVESVAFTVNPKYHSSGIKELHNVYITLHLYEHRVQ